MHDTIAARIDSAGDAATEPHLPFENQEMAGMSDGIASPPLNRTRLAPSPRRGRSPSWLPGAWGDPF
jgi:hypothetical protein